MIRRNNFDLWLDHRFRPYETAYAVELPSIMDAICRAESDLMREITSDDIIMDDEKIEEKIIEMLDMEEIST